MMWKVVLLSLSVVLFVLEVCAVNKPACPKISIKDCRVRYRQKGRFARFNCNIGFILAGEKYSTCHKGSWETPLPKCVRPSCIQVRPPQNGLIYPSHRGAVLNFFCGPGYELRGPNITYCDGKHWDNNLPACLPTNTKPPLSCDFEKDDVCGWTNDLRHDFDWTRMNYNTPSGHIGTGPSFDHTKGPGRDGYYMYIESSSRNENDRARLISPIYDKTQTNTCFQFYYHMYGATTGDLRVHLKKESDSWELNESTALFARSGNHGNQWLRGFIQLGTIDEDYQIVMEGIRGFSYISDIAIDDVRIIENCILEEHPTTPSEVLYTDAFPKIESCLNRCDHDNIVFSPDEFRISCDCDETCTEKNTCCPDYALICILESTDDDYFPDFSTTYYTETETSQSTQAKPTTVKPTRKTTATTVGTPIPTTKKTNTPTAPVNQTNSLFPRNEQNSTRPKPAPKFNTTIFQNHTNFNVVPKPWQNTATITHKPLIFIPPQSTEEFILKKIVTKQTTRRTTTRTTTTTRPLVTNRPIVTLLKRQTSPAEEIPPEAPIIIKVSTEETFEGDYLPVPTLQNTEIIEERPIDLPTIFKPSQTNPENVKERPDDTVEIFMPKVGSLNDKIVKPNLSSSNISVITISSITLVVLVIVGVVVVVRRYRLFKFSLINKTTNSDSHSDVRFLTSDESLDFTLMHPGGEDDF